MWLFTALLGGVAAALIEPSLWPVGAGIGGGLGWLLGSGVGTGRAETQRKAEARLLAMERQIVELRHRVTELESPRAEAVEPPTAPVQPPAPAPAPPAARPEPVREPARPAPRPRAPERPPQPRLEDWALWRLIAGQNALVRVGIVLLFFGVSFLLRLAYSHLHVPIEVRMLAVAAGGALLFGIGWRLRARRRGFALSLQGGGVGILYLTIFASLRMFELIPPGLALALMAGLAAVSVALAVAQESQVFAVLGVTGGFLAPLLASSGGGSHVLLFEYYAVLNAYVLCMAWLRSWRPLASLGFAFTFVIGGLWGYWAYLPEQVVSTEIFLVLFFLIYVAVPILFARRPDVPGDEWVDTGLVFAVPLAGFGLQVGLVREFEYGAAWSALALATFYLGLARLFWSRTEAKHRFLAESYLALGVGFATLAIPLAWDAHWTSASWAVEGAALVWAGVRTRRALARGFGVALQLAAGVAFLWGLDAPAAHLALADSLVLGSAFIALSGLFSAWRLERRRAELESFEDSASPALLMWGLAWWAAASYFELDAHVRAELRIQGAVWFAIGSCWALSELHRRIDWRLAWIPALGLLPVMFCLWVATVADGRHALEHFAWLAWLAAFASHLGLLDRHESACSGDEVWFHAAGVWLLAAVTSREIAWAVEPIGSPVWELIGRVVGPAALIAALTAFAPRLRWPVGRHISAYLATGAAPVAVFVGAWAIAANFASDGDPAPLRYLPVLNPLDLAQALALALAGVWLAGARRLAALRVPFEWLWAVAFVCANGALLRAIHQLAGVPFEPDDLFRSDLVQTSLSIFWTLIALGAMVLASRRALRHVWLAGSGLIGVVVVKLFLVDLSNVGTLERIVSFIGVGLLLLVIGYFSPVPPREGSSATRA